MPFCNLLITLNVIGNFPLSLCSPLPSCEAHYIRMRKNGNGWNVCDKATSGGGHFRPGTCLPVLRGISLVCLFTLPAVSLYFEQVPYAAELFPFTDLVLQPLQLF